MHKGREPNDVEIRILRAIGASFNDDGAVTCSGRKGIVYMKLDGEPKCIANNRKGKPLVVGCEHEALDLILMLYHELMLQGLKAVLTGRVDNLPHVPKPEDFIYVFVEDTTAEPEITATPDADAVFASIKSL